MVNLRKHRDIKLVAIERRRNYLVSEPNDHATKFWQNLLAIEMKKKTTEILINKPAYLGLPILELWKMNTIMKDELSKKIMIKFVRLRGKI